MSGPEPSWPDPTRPEKSRWKELSRGWRASLSGTAGAFLTAAVAVAGLATAIAVIGRGADGGPSATPTLSTVTVTRPDATTTTPYPVPVLRLSLSASSIPVKAFRGSPFRRRFLLATRRAAEGANSRPAEALFRLERLERRLDGCLTRSGSPDANDWIIDCAVQLQVRPQLHAAIASLSG
jgi:hypothetical protein